MTDGEPPALRVLLVDDNDDHRFLARRALQALPPGRRVDLVVARDGDEGLRACAAEPRPDLVLLDIKMPRKDGFEVLAALRADPRLARLPVVMLTSSEHGADVERARASGADDYVTKALDPRAFAEAVRGAVERWRDEALRRRAGDRGEAHQGAA